MQMQLWMIITTRGISAFTGDSHSYYAMIPHSVTSLGIPGDTELDCLEHGIVLAPFDIYVFGVPEPCVLQLPVGRSSVGCTPVGCSPMVYSPVVHSPVR